MSKTNERQTALRSAGTKYTTLKDLADRVLVSRCPFNETQTVTGLSASDGVVIPASMIPANAAIVDNLKISNGTYNTAAPEGGVIAMEGTAVTGFILAGTFVHDPVTVLDDYGNILNAVQIRDEATHDPVRDNNDREVFGLLVRLSGSVDDATIEANPNENLELCFVVNDGTGTLAAPAGGVTGAIEFNLNRAFGWRYLPKIALDGGNAYDLDLIGNNIHLGEYTMTTASAAAEVLTLSTNVWSGTGVSTYRGDATKPSLNASLAAFIADNTCKVYLNGVLQTKGALASSFDAEWVSTDTIKFLGILDIGDVITIERAY